MTTGEMKLLLMVRKVSVALLLLQQKAKSENDMTTSGTQKIIIVNDGSSNDIKMIFEQK